MQTVSARVSTTRTWQRTDTVGTELVVSRPGAADATAVVAGPVPYASRWHADLAESGVVRSLHVTCEGAGWRRELWLDHTPAGWTCVTDATGDLAGVACGTAESLPEDAYVRLADSPAFLSWIPAGPVTVVTVRAPWLSVVTSSVDLRRLSDTRLRVSEGRHCVTLDLDSEGTVVYQPGRVRLVR